MLDKYEETVLVEIARHIVEPGSLVKVAGLVARPLESVLSTVRSGNNPLIQRVEKTVSQAAQRGIEKVITTAGSFTKEMNILQQYQKNRIYLASLGDIKNLRLEYIDKVAAAYTWDNRALIGAEGVVMGAATALAEGSIIGTAAVPALITADVSLSFAFLARAVCQTSAIYGYAPRDPLHLPHLLAALVPHQSLTEESYFAGKGLAVQAILQSKQFLLQNAGRAMEEKLLRQQAPQLLRLITFVLSRVGLLITEKELALLLPVAGAALNSGANLLFQEITKKAAKDYFRLLFLEDRYGSELIQNRLALEIERLRRQ
ncbi:MAG: EcsC family protein [Sporomusaceae bacterium]|nr:EcsC family protein [Sporomusaceae bacterium]